METIRIHEEPFTCQRDGLTIRGMQYLPENLQKDRRCPVVIMCHGFMGDHRDMSYFGKAFAKAGYAAFSFSFCGGGRLTGESCVQSDGRTTDMTVMTEVQDVLAVKEYVCGRPFVDTENIILLGESQGGFVSGLTAADCGGAIRKLIMIYPALCIPEHARRGCLGGGSYDPQNVPEIIDCGETKLGRAFHEEAAAMEPYQALSRYEGDVLILQGLADPIVHYSYAVRAKACYREGQCHLQLIRDLGHGLDEAYHESVFASIRQFLSGRKEILTIRVVITHIDTETTGDTRRENIFFTGYCETEYFQGAILPEGCDVQTYSPETGRVVRAEYEMKGLDRDGKECFIHIVNQRRGEDWRPTVETDSRALSWMNHANLYAVLEYGHGGPTVRIFA